MKKNSSVFRDMVTHLLPAVRAILMNCEFSLLSQGITDCSSSKMIEVRKGTLAHIIILIVSMMVPH